MTIVDDHIIIVCPFFDKEKYLKEVERISDVLECHYAHWCNRNPNLVFYTFDMEQLYSPYLFMQQLSELLYIIVSDPKANFMMWVSKGWEEDPSMRILMANLIFLKVPTYDGESRDNIELGMKMLEEGLA